ncbi:MAG TPA: S1 RNA-binding domain-containing protein, partial [Chitinophagaceae bacterium]|nr:S1 RNA-binding domain-containing protein [Chitinophagaceae bacterium]
IQEIQKVTGTTINIEEVGNTGEVSIFSQEKESLLKAVEWVKGIVAVPQVGEVYDATVKSIKEFGAFVEFLPKKEGLLHISEISWKRLESMDGIFKEGDKVKVKLLEIDQRTGKFKLSRKALMPRPERQDKPQQPTVEG